MTDHTSQQMVDNVRAQNRWRNRAIIAVVVVVAVVFVGVVVYFGVTIYSAAVDSHSAAIGARSAADSARNAANQTTGLQQQVLQLQQQNHDLLDKVNAATSPQQQQANAKATSDAINKIVRCTNNHIDVLARIAAPMLDCGPAPILPSLTAPTTTTTVPVKRTAPPAAPPVASPAATVSPSCRVRVGVTCLIP